ncbi:MAG TPA: PrsW family glutamic-type intramembrane protease [Ktedonobacteraceae bacterium]|nr:PrsW family glutamic-type intramembrane protease [Ktedonobacteraceae bacterium]
MSQHYGVLRVVRVRPPVDAPDVQSKYPTGWLPEEGLVHLLTHRETTIGRALNNDIILMDPTVSREHARLILDKYGWHVVNLTTRNVVRVNGTPVPSGTYVSLQPQDLVVLGSTTLQLIAPQAAATPAAHIADEVTNIFPAAHLASPDAQIAPAQGLSVEWGRPQQFTGSYQGTQTPATVGHGQHTQIDRSRNLAALPIQPDPEQMPQPWDDEEESLIGAGVTMQFALPQRMGIRTRWLIAGIGFAILIISAIVTVALNSLLGISALAQGGFTNILAAITIPLVPAIGINLLVNFMDRFEREPWFLRMAAFLWGALIAIPPALFIEHNVDGMLQTMLGQGTNPVLRSALEGLNAGITEETIKGLGLLLLFVILRDEFDNVTDGIVYGALIGAGFALVENFRYFATGSKQFLLFLIVGRIILGWLGHSTFTVCFGAGLGYIRHTRVRWRQILIPLLGYLIAVGLHSFFDFVDFQASAAVGAAPANSTVATLSLIAIIGNYIPPFWAQMAILYILIKGLAHEGAVIREFLAIEVSNGVVLVDEYALLQNSFTRTREERRVLFRRGFRQWLRVKALYQTEIGLAFRKWHVSMGDKPKLGYRQPEDAYRKRIRRLRNEIVTEETRIRQQQSLQPAR